MKIVGYDNFGRDTVSEHVVCENLNSYWGPIIFKFIIDNHTSDYNPFYYKLVEDNYKLYTWEP